jgi:hypothetical protein
VELHGLTAAAQQRPPEPCCAADTGECGPAMFGQVARNMCRQ